MKRPSVRTAALALFGLSGFSALLYEVLWFRALSFMLGSTLYSASTMLGAFMAGLALGALLGGRLADRLQSPLRALALLELGIGFAGGLTLFWIYRLPPVYFWLFQGLHREPWAFYGGQFALCFALLLVPTALMGATLPVMVRLLAEELGSLGRRTGQAYAVNTLGGLLGAVLGGVLLLPALGLRLASLVAAGGNFLASAGFLALAGAERRVWLPAAGFLALALLSMAGGWRFEDHLANFYLAGRFRSYEELRAAQQREREVFYGEYPQGSVRAYIDGMGFLIIQTGGKMEGTPFDDVPNAMLASYIPVAAHRGRPQKALVIGLGAGWTLRAARRYVPQVDVVEINPGVVEAARRFGHNREVLGQARVILDDGRRFLTYARGRYDIITSEPSYPASSEVTSLFTREFYRIALERLNEGGVFSQWLPAWALRRAEAYMMVKTFASVFEHVQVYQVPISRDLIMIGSAGPLRSPEEVVKAVKAMEHWGFPLEFSLFMGELRVKALLRSRGLPLNTDDRPLLEFSVLRNLLR